ncbi:hypothetical protein TNCT_27411 [Trichonephila clavata]|uniref:Uncharacterized protein n=1 Tax=Trichonephila clavata TaxID=2740835 RepID=A0A8X6KQT4_TRICU|nr:hypothetical protein TNCT_27411 [Trichonephila clavata]
MSSSDSSEIDHMRRDNEERCDEFESDSGSDIIIPREKLRVISDSSDDDEVTTSTSDSIDEFLPVGSIFSNESNSFSEVTCVATRRSQV